MSYKVEKEWDTRAGLKAVAILTDNSHRCGYVSIDDEHPLYGKNYGDHIDCEWQDIVNNRSVERMGDINAFLASAAFQSGEKPKISYFFDVWGSITYMETNNEYPIKTENIKT